MSDPRYSPNYVTSGLSSQIATATDAINNALKAVPAGIHMQPALQASDALNSLMTYLRMFPQAAVSVAWQSVSSPSTLTDSTSQIQRIVKDVSNPARPTDSKPSSVAWYVKDHAVLRDEQLALPSAPTVQAALEVLWFGILVAQSVRDIRPAADTFWRVVRHLKDAL